MSLPRRRESRELGVIRINLLDSRLRGNDGLVIHRTFFNTLLERVFRLQKGAAKHFKHPYSWHLLSPNQCVALVRPGSIRSGTYSFIRRLRLNQAIGKVINAAMPEAFQLGAKATNASTTNARVINTVQPLRLGYLRTE